MIRHSASRNRAFVLLVALGVLGVLGLLAATFATLSRIERSVSSSYVDKVRAKMLAQSGIERAIASLRGRAMIQAWDDTRNDWYYREMLNGAVGGLTWKPEVLAQLSGYTPVRAYGTAPRNLEQVVDDAMITGAAGGISFPDVSLPGISGAFPGTYETGGDVYALKILDCASMLYVNDQNPEIRRLLNNLGTILSINSPGFNFGDEIVAAAKLRAKPWNNKSEILDQVFIAKLGAVEGRKRYLVAKDFITCHAWVDLTTVHFGAKPVVAMGEESGETRLAQADPKEDPARALAMAAAPLAESPLFNIQARMTGTYPTLPGSRFLPVTTIPGIPISPIDQGGGFIQFVTGQNGGTVAGKFGGANHWVQPRAPININTVTREVLVAILWGLTASFVDYDHPTGTLKVRAVSISKPQAEAAADWIINARCTHGDPAGAWGYNDWMHFRHDVIDVMHEPPGAILDKFQTALIHANCNPNTEIKKLNPDMLLVDSNPRTNSQDFVRLDKSDITVKSTELSFCSGGFYEIEALGRIYSGGRIMSEEKIETVVKVYDVLRYTTQEQFEKDRNWTNDDPLKSEGSLLAGGFPPVVSMPEYPYNAGTMVSGVMNLPATPYRSTTGDFSWAADYDGYLILNGPAKVIAGTSPGKFNGGGSTCRKVGGAGPLVNGVSWKDSGKDCKISFIQGFNMGSLRPQQSHANSGVNSAKHLAPNPNNPEYNSSCPSCEGPAWATGAANTLTMDTEYKSGNSNGPKKAFQIEPGQAVNRTGTSPPSLGNGFFEGGADLQPFGVYVNFLKRRRYVTYWADEVPTGSFTVEFMYKPELDHWEWAKGLPKTSASLTWDSGPCSKIHLWGLGAATDGMNTEQWLYVWGSRVYWDIRMMNANYVIFADHQWRAHTWHHIEFSIQKEFQFTKADGSVVTVPHNAMLFIDGVPASGVLGAGQWITTTNPETAGVYTAKAMKLPTAFISTIPNNNVSSGARMGFLCKLQKYSSIFAMEKAGTCGTGDNLVIHHWRSHDAAFTPRNRYHSVSYFDGSTYKSGVGYSSEKAGVYKKRLTYLEGVVNSGKEVTVGTVSCTHYHPFHVHLYGHDGTGTGGPKPTSFGHITPALRTKTGLSYIDDYYYDGCAGLRIKRKIAAGSELYYLGWFEIASLVPVTMSPILGDISLTYFTEPKTYFRLSSTEAK